MNGPAVLLGLAFTSVDGLILAVIAVLLVMQAFLAMAEVALTRIRRARAAGLDADASTRSSRALVKLVDAPETFLNALLLVVLAAQTAQTALTTVFAERVFGSLGVVLALVVNVAIVFVITEAAPKTWAVQHLDRAALLSARPVQAFVSLPPLRMLARS